MAEMRFVYEDPNSLYQRIRKILGPQMSRYPSRRTVDAIMILTERIEELEEKVDALSK